MPSAPPEPPGPPGLYRAQSLEGLLPGLVHGFTGALASPEGRPFAEALRAHLRSRCAGAAPPLRWLEQRHSTEIVEGGEGVARGDGAVVTATAGAVAVQTADCVPILAVHKARGAVAALHAGWRGSAAGILPRLLARWIGPGDDPAGVRLAFGPSIRACCYDVREDCTGAFSQADLAGAVREREGRIFLELTRVLANQAVAFGVPPGAIEVLSLCTRCATNGAGPAPFASYRRDGHPGQPFPFRNASYIALLER